MSKEVLNNMREYLLSLNNYSSDDKRYTMDFCKKMEYLNGLRDVAIKNTNQTVTTGYGNVNSKICFVFNNEKTYEITKPLLQSILDKFRINFWNVYVTFVNKTEKDYAEKFLYLINEIHAINPGVVYIIDNSDDNYNSILSEFQKLNITPPKKHYFVELQKLASSEEIVRKDLWSIFKYLVNYKEIERDD